MIALYKTLSPDSVATLFYPSYSTMCRRNRQSESTESPSSSSSFDDWWNKTDHVMDQAMGRVSSLISPLTNEEWFNNMFHIKFDYESKNANSLWAFPVPSARQYERCKEADGKSVWNKDGVWRCLFPNDENYSKVNGDYFKDYTGFLDWRRQMKLAMVEERNKRRKEKEEQWSQWQQTNDNSSATGSSNNNNSGVKYISATEAEKQGKKIISSSILNETVTKDDGSIETKQVVKKWYDDGTTSMTESINNNNNHGDGKNGWFWK